MLGHLRPSTCSLDAESRASYMNFYCSICASLRKQHSLPYTLFINNELTLVLLAFEQNMDLEVGKTRCPSSGFTIKRMASNHEAIQLAAQLSVLLGWVKVVDWQADKPAFYKKAIQTALDKKVGNILPLVNSGFKGVLDRYINVTKSNSTDFDLVNQLTGELSSQICLAIGEKTTIQTEKLILITNLFKISGQLISIADHLIDLEKDQLANQYNPILFESVENKVSIQASYQKLLLQFNRLSLHLQELLKIYLHKEVIHIAFFNALNKALTRMKGEIHRSRPVFVEEAYMPDELIIANADCGLGVTGAECDCSEVNNYLDQQINQCCCNHCKCPCDNCCKGGGGNCCCKGGSGGNCGCNNCCNGCGNCGHSSGDCCGGCGDCCDGCGKSGNCCDCNCGGSRSSSSGSNNYEEFLRLEEEMKTLDSLNSLKGVEADIQLKEALQHVEGLTKVQIKELNLLVDSVAQDDPDKLPRVKKMVDIIRLTKTSELLKDSDMGGGAYNMIKNALVK